MDFDKPQLSSLHQCHMYLQVLWLLDLSTGTGNSLLTQNWQTYQPLSSKFVWPKAIKPSTSDWNTWDLALTKILPTSHNLMLPQKLSNYFQSTISSWYFEAGEKALWFFSGMEWTWHSNIPSQSCTMSFHCQGEISTPTQTLWRATIHLQDTKVILMGSRQINTLATTQAWLATLQNHHFTCKWKWELTIVGDLSELIADIQVGNGYAVSNGSFQVGQGAAVYSFWAIAPTS